MVRRLFLCLFIIVALANLALFGYLAAVGRGQAGAAEALPRKAASLAQAAETRVSEPVAQLRTIARWQRSGGLLLHPVLALRILMPSEAAAAPARIAGRT
jgi:hypothetical protein